LRLWLFGALRADYGGEPVRVAVRPLCAVLLAMLAIRPGARLGRKALAAELWPDESDPVRVSTNLRRHLSALQNALPRLPHGENWIETEGATLAWSARAPFWCDVAALESALNDPRPAPEALLPAGDFMEGFTHDWVVAQREHYRARAIERLLTRCVEHQDEDRLDDALTCARAVLALDPLCEDAVVLALELHGERGDPVAAGEIYANFTERLRRELDARPAPATVAAMERLRSATRSRRDHLPNPLTTYVGRGAAVAALEAALAGYRCVTIVGPAGAGKTRLSLETAAAAAHRFLDGSYFIDLSSLPVAAEIDDTVVRALDLPVEFARAGREGVRRFLRNRRALLILDNCEHVRDACAAFAVDVLEGAPRVTILATSRVALGIGAESVFRLNPLTESEARALFVERTRSAGVASEWTAADRGSIDRICELLDRSPLAIELAAGLCAAMSLSDLERLLPQRLALLRTSDPSMPDRHRSLEAAIAWSYELLEDSERQLFELLAVFPASFRFESAVAICNGSAAAMRGLIEKSMLQRDETHADRYRLLFSLAEFAQNRLAQNPAAEAVRESHARHFAELALFGEDVENPGFFRGEKRWLRDLDEELENVRAALTYLLSSAGENAQIGVRMARALERFFAMRGFYAEGLLWLERARERAAPGSREDALVRYKIGRFTMRQGAHAQALAAIVDTIPTFRAASSDLDLARALGDAGAIAFVTGDRDAAQAYLDEALAIAGRAGFSSIEAAILGNLGILASADGDLIRSSEAFTEAARLFKRLGDRRFLARMLANLAGNEYMSGRYEAAAATLGEALEIARGIGAAMLGVDILCELGLALLASGRLDAARARFTEALAEVAPLGLPYETAHALLGFASVAATCGDPRLAARLTGAATPFIERDLRRAHPQSPYQRLRAAAIEHLGEAEFERERKLGELLELEAAIELAAGALAHR
jgi:predicted ATPase/DNA-binding SARP family transcriptional activator